MTKPKVETTQPVNEFVWVKEEITTLDALLTQVIESKNSTRELMIRASWLALKHFHNSGDPTRIQRFYDILSEDGNLFRKAAFVKWVKTFANANFSDSSKKFTKNVNTNAKNRNYQEDSVIGSDLLAKARLLPFFKIEMSEEKTEETVYDKLFSRADKSVSMIDKGVKKGDFQKDAVLTEVEKLLARITELTKPLTTAEIMKAKQEPEVHSEVVKDAA